MKVKLYVTQFSNDIIKHIITLQQYAEDHKFITDDITSLCNKYISSISRAYSYIQQGYITNFECMETLVKIHKNFSDEWNDAVNKLNIQEPITAH